MMLSIYLIDFVHKANMRALYIKVYVQVLAKQKICKRMQPMHVSCVHASVGMYMLVCLRVGVYSGSVYGGI